MKDRLCIWMPHGFMSVDLQTEAGKAFLKSLYTQYAEWGVDFGSYLTSYDRKLLLFVSLSCLT